MMKGFSIDKHLIIIGLISIVLSCKKESTHSVFTIDVDHLEVKNLFSYKRPIDNCRFVVLETTNDCLIGEIEKVRVESDLIFVKDENKNLFVFTMNGKFLNKIGNIGQGSEELLSFVDFYINSNKKYVGIYDVLRSKVLRFSFDGKYINSYNCTEKMIESYNIVGQIGNDLLIGMRNNHESEFAYILVSEVDYSFKKGYLPFSIIGNVSCSPLKSIASQSKNGIYNTTYFSDYIFKLSGKNILEKVLFVKSNQKVADAEILSELNAMNLETASDASAILRRKGFSAGVRSVYSTDEYLYINYPLPNYESCCIFYNTETGVSYKSITDKSDFFGQSWDAALTTTDKEIIYALQPERIIELKNLSDLFADTKVLENIKSVQEFDNPVLVFFSSGYE